MAGSHLVLLLQRKRPAGPWLQWISSPTTHLLTNAVNGLVADAALNLSANPISKGASQPDRLITLPAGVWMDRRQALAGPE
jgi:hypothetical protein